MSWTKATLLAVLVCAAGFTAAATQPLPPSLPYTSGLKIGVKSDGIYELPFETLSLARVPVSTIPVRRYRLFTKGTEVPLYTAAMPSSPLRPGDRLFFYGEYLRGGSQHYTQYSETNVYWLTWSDTAVGIRMAMVSGELRIDETIFSNDSTELRASEIYDTLHLEQDNDIRWLGSIENPGEMTEATAADSLIDNWYWGLAGIDELTSFPVTIPSPATTGKARIRISFMGLTSEASDPVDHQVSILINNNPAGSNNSAQWDGQKPFMFESDTFPVSLLKPGANTLSFIVKRRSYQDRIALNWVSLEYRRSFRTVNDQMVFKSGDNAVGKVTQFTFTGFSSPAIELWDIGKHRFFTNFKIVRGSGNDRELYSLIFQDSIATPTTYLAQTAQQRLTPASLSLDTIRTDWRSMSGSDYLVIGASWARPIIAPLCALHEARGLRTAFFDINDIYNGFSWGIASPESIRNLMTALTAQSPSRPPRFLLLTGDCTHDLDKKNQSRTIVPTHLSLVPGWGLASDDDYFTLTTGNDQFPDLCVGRFPAENETHLRTMVDKTIAAIQSPERGPWRDNLLLASGYEKEFTAFTTELEREVTRPRMNILRMDADPGSPFYKDEITASSVMANFINQGIYALNFNGHGGGNIWSDSRFFGYNDLQKLHNDQWGRSGRLPIVFSFTCLTGFFESVDYRSLGEEFVRAGKNGALCFYGASAYTSKKGNLLFNRILLEKALSGAFATVGELIHASETAMLAQHGATYLPLVRQYNLLGDPALPWKLTPDTLRCTLSKSALSGGDSLSVRALCAPVDKGSALVTIGDAAAVWNRFSGTVNNGVFTTSSRVKDSIKTSSGMVRVYAWDDSSDVMGWTFFSKDTIAVREIRTDPPRFSLGDTVALSCRLTVPATANQSTVYCLYAIASPHVEGVTYTGIRMSLDTLGRWTTPRSIAIRYNDQTDQALLVYFRLQSGDMTRESERTVFAIEGRPDLAFTGKKLSVSWLRDSLTVPFEVINKGNAAAPPFDITFFWGADAGNDTIGHVIFTGSLEPGKTWKGFLSLPDTQGLIPFTAVLNDRKSFTEQSMLDNRLGGSLQVACTTLAATSDTLYSLNRGVSISPVRPIQPGKKVFLFVEPNAATTPLATESRWLALTGDSVAQATIGTRPALLPEDSLLWRFRTVSSLAIADRNAAGRYAIMRYDSLLTSWSFAGERTEETPPALLISSAGYGPYAAALLEDVHPPSIQVSVYGRELRFLDYAAKDQPFNILMADPSGILPSSVAITLNRRPLRDVQQSALPKKNDMRNLTVTVYPPPERTIDSLFVTASDLAGNRSEQAFAYKPGEELAIKFFSCHPNPFSLRLRGPNNLPRNVRFAFQLTNAADITPSIYTVTGKRIWSVKQTIYNPYVEIPWNGRDHENYRIGNGTYYAKLVAKNNKRTVKKTIRIAKLEGY